MEFIVDLWLPIVVSAVAVFFASFLAWMVIGHHKSDWKGLGDEEAARGAIRGTDPGQYVLPYCGQDWKSEEAKRKYQEGPVAYVTVAPTGFPKMGGKMLACVCFNLVVSIFSAYIASLILPAGAGFGPVFRIVGTIAVAAYALGGIPNGIWFAKPRSAMVKDVLDGVAYGLVTGAIFALMWPGA